MSSQSWPLTGILKLLWKERKRGPATAVGTECAELKGPGEGASSVWLEERESWGGCVKVRPERWGRKRHCKTPRSVFCGNWQWGAVADLSGHVLGWETRQAAFPGSSCHPTSIIQLNTQPVALKQMPLCPCS